MYNERIQMKDKQATVRLQMTEVRQFKTYGMMQFKELFARPVPSMIIMCFDLTKRDSLTKISLEYLAELKHHMDSKSQTQLLVVGTKSDLEGEREVSFEEGLSLA